MDDKNDLTEPGEVDLSSEIDLLRKEIIKKDIAIESNKKEKSFQDDQKPWKSYIFAFSCAMLIYLVHPHIESFGDRISYMLISLLLGSVCSLVATIAHEYAASRFWYNGTPIRTQNTIRCAIMIAIAIVILIIT